MRRSRFIAVLPLLMATFAGAQGAGPAPRPEPSPVPNQDLKMLRFIERALPWYPDSTFAIVGDERHQTPSGAYRVINVKRECDSRFLSGITTWVVDEAARVVWQGAVGNLPGEKVAASGSLEAFLKDFLPPALLRAMRLKTTVVWDAGGDPTGALIPFGLEVQTGYGTYRMPAAVTSDGARMVLGPTLPLDRDPVEWRRALLAKSDLVMWDHPGSQARVAIVEFSDFECPGCKTKWPIVASVLEELSAKVRHGMVNFPLTNIHPWAFRAASAAWCVTRQDPTALIPLKEQFYSMQRDMETSLVGPTAKDYVAGRGLDEAAFDACFLGRDSIAAVHRQIELAQRLRVDATPTYFVNGWKVQAPKKEWFGDLVRRLAAGQEP